MATRRVTLLRARTTLPAALMTLGLCVPQAARAAGDHDGGMRLPGTDLPGEPAPAASTGLPSAYDAAGSGSMASPDTSTATLEATIVGATPAVSAPPLATPLRRDSDPVALDLAGLAAPSAIAAVDGHVVIVRPRGGRSELVDVADPAAPRILLSSTRAFGVPNAGHDADGHPVVVASPCAGTDAVVLLNRPPNCPLRAIDLTTGASRAVPGTTGALQGDIAGRRVFFTRLSPRVGVRLYVQSASSVRPVGLPKMGRGAPDWPSTLGTPVGGTLSAGGIDISADGRVAVVLGHRSRSPQYTSSLWVRDARRRWHREVSVNTPSDDLGVRRVLGPQLDDGGVRAYVEGVVNGPSFVGRWTTEGQQTTKVSVRRSIGRATILRDVAYDGSRMVFVDWLPGLPCGSEGAKACGLRAIGPISVR